MKKIASLFFASMLCVCLFSGCSVAPLSPENYVAWVNDEAHGVLNKKTITDFEFSLLYESPEYLAIRELKPENCTADLVSKKKKDLGNLQYYAFQIKSNDGQEVLRAGIADDQEYYARLEYFSSMAQNDMVLVEGGDTLPCVLYHYERTYNLSPKSTILLAFEKTPAFTTSDKLFIYNDQTLGIGSVQLTIRSQDIQHLPLIEYVQH